MRLFALLLTLALAGAWAQDRRPNLDVESYKIAVTVNPADSSLKARAEVSFKALDDSTTSAVFELNNNLTLLSVTDSRGSAVNYNRNNPDFTVRVGLASPLRKGDSATLVFNYEGRFTGQEESPVYGIRFASIQPGYTYLLYPSRWFPINGYTADRYTAEIRVEAPAEFTVTGGDLSKKDGAATILTWMKPSFPGSIALVKEQPRRVTAQGFNTTFYLRSDKAALAQPLGEEIGKVMTYLGSLYGLPPSSALTVVQTEEGAPNGYSAPGFLFLSPGGIGAQPSPRLLANQLTRQWFGNLFSPVNRNHLWINNGFARYAEVMYSEHLNGPSALETEARDLYIDALTVTEAPVRQAARFEDYSPELFALTGSKGAAVLHMLRWILGDDKYKEFLRVLADTSANKSIATDDVRRVAEQVGQRPLQGFFIQWLESTGAPEFNLEYTILRTQKGFRVMGKIAQDLDTFRMPVDLKIETEGNPEEKRVEVSGTSSEFLVDTFGKPKKVIIDPAGRVLRLNPDMRVAVAIRRGEQLAEIGEFTEALREYQKALDVNRISSLAHYRVGEVFFMQGNYQPAANEFREAQGGDLEPSWVKVWSHIYLGKIYDISQQRERAVNEYTQAVRTKDNTQGAQEEAAKYLKAPYVRPDRN